MDAANFDYRENRIRENKKRRERIVRRQWAMLITSVIVAIIIFIILFLGAGMVLHAQLEQMRFKYYTKITVEAGETLTDIAHKYYSEDFESIEEYMNEVCSINHLKDSERLYAGTDIIVPYYSAEYK